MITGYPNSRKAFTLVELAIVLAIAGLLFTGLWRLLATGNQQLKDSSAASQQAQLISSVKNFLASASGQTFMSPNAAQVPFNLPLPQNANNAGGQPTCPSDPALAPLLGNAAQWCASMPPGFYALTANSYGQTYQIQVRVESTAGGNSAPNSYSFMIVTQGTAVVTDASGGRISSQIGGDGGFIYSTPTCGAANLACGSYGGWSTDPVLNYKATAASGHIASRSYVSPDQGSSAPWLARVPVPGDLLHTFNTFANTDVYLNASGILGTTATNTLLGTTGNNPNAGYGALPAYGGFINQINEIIAGNNDNTTKNNENPAITLNGPIDPNFSYTPCIASTATTTAGTGNNATTSFTTVNNQPCHAVLQINGNQSTTGMVQANILWASSFIYGTLKPSDIRLKTNVIPLQNALDDIMKLKPVTFRYKKGNKEDIGFIAQDVQKVFPQIVVGKPDGDLGVDYMSMLAPLVSSVQQLKKENDELRVELVAQQREVKKLQDKSASQNQ